MSNEELMNVVGGATSYTSGSFLNSVVRVIGAFLDIGRNIGSAINYLIYGKKC